MKKMCLCLLILATLALPCFAGYYTCKSCNGTGVKGTKNCSRCNGAREITVSCSVCNGRGEVRDQYGDLQTCSSCHGFRKEYVTCPKCNGSGNEPWICPTCNGSRKVYIAE